MKAEININTRHGEAILIANELVEGIRLLSKTFPESEDMVMVPDIRNAVMNLHKSVLMTALTENGNDFHYYTDEIRGKAAVLDTLLQMCLELDYCNEKMHKSLSEKIEKIIALAEKPDKPKLSIVKGAGID